MNSACNSVTTGEPVANFFYFYFSTGAHGRITQTGTFGFKKCVAVIIEYRLGEFIRLALCPYRVIIHNLFTGSTKGIFRSISAVVNPVNCRSTLRSA